MNTTEIKEKMTPELFEKLISKFERGFGKIEDLSFKDQVLHLMEFGLPYEVRTDEKAMNELQTSLGSAIVFHNYNAYAIKSFIPKRKQEMIDRYASWALQIKNPKFTEWMK